MQKQPIFCSLIALAILLGVVWSSKKDDPAAVTPTTPTTPVVTKSTAKDITPLGGI